MKMRGISVLGASAIAPLIVSASASPQAAPGYGNAPFGAATAAIEALNKGFYNTTDGRWDTNDAWWLTGISLQTILDYMLLTGTKQYLPQARHTFEQQKKPLPWWPAGKGYFRADSTDDTGWWALAMVSLFDLTKSTEYLNVARLDEAYLYSYWNTSTCNGGVIWDIPTLEYKNAISNELYLKVVASLHNRIPGDRLYLQRAQETWKWFKASGMINSQHLVNDGLAQEANGACTNNGQTTWTYNQGVLLGGLTELYRATGDRELIRVARSIADAVIASQTLSPGGILKEPCDGGGCSSDQSAFKGIFAKNLAELNTVLQLRSYREYLARNAESVWLHARNESNFFSTSWTGPFDGVTVGSQASAANVLLYAS